MTRSRRAGILWGVFALGLVLALWGWLWVVQRLVRSEAEAGTVRVMEAEERYLQEIAPAVEGLIQSEVDAVLETVDGSGNPERIIPAMARQGSMTGVWFEPEQVDEPFDTRIVEEWRRRVREETVEPSDLAAALRSGELSWGWTQDGRDVVAGLALSLFRRFGPDEELTPLLRERVWDYNGPPLRPAFRLILIEELHYQKDPALWRLRWAETLRVGIENRGLEESVRDYEVVRRSVGGRTLHFFWKADRLEKVINRDREERLCLREVVEVGAAAVRLNGLERWSFLCFEEGEQLESSATTVNEQALIWVGATSGLLVLALAIGAALIARSEYRLARMRTDLAASVAHELRTPLAGQRLLLESLIERDGMPESERDDYVRMALRENLRLGRLAEEFLTFSRLERGVLVLESEGVELGKVVNEAVESLREKWEDPDCRLTVDVSPDLPLVRGDEQALVTVVRNLLENAWKYSGEEKVITVTAGAEGGGVWVAVRDNGIGLDAKDQERIFRQFYRVDQRLAQEREGLGIGLSIVRRLVQAMLGKVTVESEVGAGSEFKVWLPAGS